MPNYDFAAYCSMLTDEPRVTAYVSALREAVREDSVVLDLGSGTGFFSFLACKFGAKKVYAVETNVLIQLSREFAAANDCADKIEFIEKISTEIELEEKADILICDLHGTFPLYEASLTSIIDARKRLLKPGAILIPKRETIYFAVAEGEEFYEKNVARYLREVCEIKMDSGRRLITNRMLNAWEQELNLLSKGEVFAVLDYTTLEETDFSAELIFSINKKGTANGLRGWFECELGENLKTTNSPEKDDCVYGAPIFPFDEAVEVDVGDRVRVALSAKHEKGEYVWDWHTKIYSGDDQLKAEFRQSTLAALFISPKDMLKQSEYFAPKQNTDAKIDSFILNKIDGETLAGDIADELLATFPEKFKTFEEALARVSRLLPYYSE
jgi:protein arginine N-methyltransferase 1